MASIFNFIMDRGVCIAALLLLSLNYTDFVRSGWGFAGCNSLWTGESVYHAAVVFCLQGLGVASPLVCLTVLI